jgi:hypothetical protein
MSGRQTPEKSSDVNYVPTLYDNGSLKLFDVFRVVIRRKKIQARVLVDASSCRRNRLSRVLNGQFQYDIGLYNALISCLGEFVIFEQRWNNFGQHHFSRH